MWPWFKTPLTSECFKLPSNVTLCWRRFCSRTSSRSQRLGPSPPIKKCTFLYKPQIWGMMRAKRSTPLRYTRRETITTVTENSEYDKWFYIFRICHLRLLIITVVVVLLGEVRSKMRRVHSIWNDRNTLFVNLGSQHCIFLASVRDANTVTAIR